MDNNKLTQEQIAQEQRKRQLAVVKATNQMLKEAKEVAMNRIEDPIEKARVENSFDSAMKENTTKAKNFLHASQNEIEGSEFRGADKMYVDKYNERLKKKGITDEQLRRKEEATVTVGKKDKDGKVVQRRPRKGAKKVLDDIERLENEEELMKQSMVKDDEDIKRAIERNLEFEAEQQRKLHDSLEKVKENIKDEKETTKVKVSGDANVGRAKVETETKKEEKKQVSSEATAVDKPKKKKEQKVITYDFDFSSIDPCVQYDVIPLPSKGQCYPVGHPLRSGRIPVAYLTAADENIIASPNVYRDGKLFDIILERKVLDKRFKVSEIVSGDRDAIILWLRATSYTADFPITATNPEDGKEYNLSIDLGQFDYLDFDLEGDENGLFDFEASNGDKIKFKFLTDRDNEEIKASITNEIGDKNKLDFLTNFRQLKNIIDNFEINEDEKRMIEEDLGEILEIVGDDVPEIDETVFPSTITKHMIMHTVSVNGKTDRKFIENYINNMRSKDALAYRNHVNDNRPGVDFSFEVNIPESDGGGSFATFLRLTDTVFINF